MSTKTEMTTVREVLRLCALLDRDGLSYRVRIVPPRGRTHRRPAGRARVFVVEVYRG